MSSREIAALAKQAFPKLSASGIDTRNAFISSLAIRLKNNEERVLLANQTDLENAQHSNLSEQLSKRLLLGSQKINTLSDGLIVLASKADPLGKVTLSRELDKGLVLNRVSCPIGLLCIIFESRPEAVIQICSLAIKSGNCVILKGGKEAENSNKVLVELIRDSLQEVGLPKECVDLVTSRDDVKQLLAADDLLDLVIPRGSNSLVKYIKENTLIPVLGHADGICHLFVDEDADIALATKVCVDAKTEYTAVCNATECFIVARSVLSSFMKKIFPRLVEKSVRMNVDPEVQATIQEQGLVGGEVHLLYKGNLPLGEDAKAKIFKREYLGLEVSIVVVEGVAAAISHINSYGSHHTDGILTENQETADKFCLQVDSAGVFVNCSTRFADGFRYGFGAEVGVSTNKLHARGPVGLEGLVTYKYQCVGQGHVVAPYNKKEKVFTHKDLSLK